MNDILNVFNEDPNSVLKFVESIGNGTYEIDQDKLEILIKQEGPFRTAQSFDFSKEMPGKLAMSGLSNEMVLDLIRDFVKQDLTNEMILNYCIEQLNSEYSDCRNKAAITLINGGQKSKALFYQELQKLADDKKADIILFLNFAKR